MLSNPPNFWDILHNYVMNSIFPTFADALPELSVRLIIIAAIKATIFKLNLFIT